MPLAADVASSLEEHLEAFSSLGFWAGVAPDAGPLICHFCGLFFGGIYPRALRIYLAGVW